jgi:hypothetical protein
MSEDVSEQKAYVRPLHAELIAAFRADKLHSIVPHLLQNGLHEKQSHFHWLEEECVVAKKWAIGPDIIARGVAIAQQIIIPKTNLQDRVLLVYEPVPFNTVASRNIIASRRMSCQIPISQS